MPERTEKWVIEREYDPDEWFHWGERDDEIEARDLLSRYRNANSEETYRLVHIEKKVVG